MRDQKQQKEKTEERGHQTKTKDTEKTVVHWSK